MTPQQHQQGMMRAQAPQQGMMQRAQNPQHQQGIMRAQNPQQQQQSMMQRPPQNTDPYYMAAYGSRPTAANNYPTSMAPAMQQQQQQVNLN